MEYIEDSEQEEPNPSPKKPDYPLWPVLKNQRHYGGKQLFSNKLPPRDIEPIEKGSYFDLT